METETIVADTEDVNDCTTNDCISLYPIWLRKLSEDYPTPLNEQERLTFERFVAERVHKYSVIHKQCNVIRKGWRSLRQVIDALECEKAELEKSLAFNEKEGTVKPQKQLPESVETTNSSSLSNIINSTVNNAVNSNVSTQGEPQTSTITLENAVIKKPQRSIRRSAMFANMQNVLHRATREAADTVATVTAKREHIAKQTRLSIVDEDLNIQRVLMEPLQQKLEKVTVVECEAEKEVTELLTLLHDMMTLETVYCSSFSLKAAGSLPLQDVMSNRESSHTSKSHCGKQEEEEEKEEEHHKSFMYDIHFQPACHTPEVEDIIRSQIEEVLDSYVAYRARLDPILHKRLEEEEVKRAAKVHDLLQLIGLNEEYDNNYNNRNFAMSPTSTHFQDNLSVSQNTVQGAMYNSTEPSLPLLDVSASAKQNIMFISDSDSDAESDEHLRKVNNNDSETASADNKRDRARIQSALAALDDFEEMY